MNPERKKIADAILKEWADRGTIIEGGWQAFLYLGKLEDASEVQKGEMRRAFYIGAQHLFASLMGIMDPGLEPTEADLKKVDLIAAELERFRKEELGAG